MRLSMLFAALLAVASPARAMTITVHAGESIQAAVDRAPAGATIRIEPGTYTESGAVRALTVTKDRIHLVAAARKGQAVVLRQSGTQTQGIWVSPDDSLDPANVELPPCGVSGRRLRGFDVRGITVEGFEGFGIYLACVDGFRVDRTITRDNHTYAVFPVRSSHGRITRNQASGTLTDSCLYTGQDERILVDHNMATGCLIGLQIENSSHIRYVKNVARDNTAGMIVDIIDGRQVSEVSDNLVADNTFADNNRMNGSTDPETSQLPPGIGLIIDGADRTLVTRNRFQGNSFTGMTITDFCTGDPEACGPGLAIDPNPDGNRIVRNTFGGNGQDVIYLPGGGQGNCFANNKPPTLKSGTDLPGCR
jgi:nitrous oxidase accessory protein NosD